LPPFVPAVADKIHNAEFQVREPHIRVEDIIDVIEGKNSASLLLLLLPPRRRGCALLMTAAPLLPASCATAVVYCPCLYIVCGEGRERAKERYRTLLTSPPCVLQLNKIDSISIEELELLDRVPHYVPVSAHHGWGFDDMLEKARTARGLPLARPRPSRLLLAACSDLGVLRHDPHLHEAARPDARLQRARHPASRLALRRAAL